jgi:aspartyl/asparaginyl-tRNA synthetase
MYFTVGLNRLVQGFLGLSDVRETVLFPRDAGRLAP